MRDSVWAYERRGEGARAGHKCWSVLSDDRSAVKVVLNLRKYYAFGAFTYHVRYVLPTRVEPGFRSFGAFQRACRSGQGQHSGGAAGAGSHTLRRLGKERALYRFLTFGLAHALASMETGKGVKGHQRFQSG